MDDDIRQSLTDIKQSLRDGFVDVNDRIDKLVTKEAFDAQIARLDEADRYQKESLAHHIKDNEEDFHAFRATTRWALGFGLTGAGVLAAVVFGILQAVATGHP